LKILLVEDDPAKAAKIEALVAVGLGNEPYELVRAGTVNDAIAHLAGSKTFDLVIVDLVLPQIKGGDAVDATHQWCELIENHLTGRTAAWIVMTGFAAIEEEARRSFSRHNVAVISYDASGVWERNLSSKLREAFDTRALDFVIVCALEKERGGYAETVCDLGEKGMVNGIDYQQISIGGLRGVIVVQPGPGMVSAAITTTKALAKFRPRAVAMSGICGGIEGEAKLGALIVADISWNYQSGKFKDGKLTPDLLQVPLTPSVRTTLSQLASDDHSATLRVGLMHQELAGAGIHIVTMVSGSQVVADSAVTAIIAEQGRKVAAVDMEVASVYFAARDFFDGGGAFFAAKTVVDLANPHKDDRYHEYGCALSARFIVQAIQTLLAQ
jgi:nucleoside phosphorylase